MKILFNLAYSFALGKIIKEVKKKKNIVMIILFTEAILISIMKQRVN